jgi:hypothetical protein
MANSELTSGGKTARPSENLPNILTAPIFQTAPILAV